jgi:hypothetical protein
MTTAPARATASVPNNSVGTVTATALGGALLAEVARFDEDDALDVDRLALAVFSA